MVEQGTENPRVAGSIPAGGTNADVAHLVERHLAKVEVASSSLVARSNLGIPLAVAPSDCEQEVSPDGEFLRFPARISSLSFR